MKKSPKNRKNNPDLCSATDFMARHIFDRKCEATNHDRYTARAMYVETCRHCSHHEISWEEDRIEDDPKEIENKILDGTIYIADLVEQLSTDVDLWWEYVFHNIPLEVYTENIWNEDFLVEAFGDRIDRVFWDCIYNPGFRWVSDQKIDPPDFLQEMWVKNRGHGFVVKDFPPES